MPGGLQWARDGRDWPHRGHSEFMTVAGQHWHVQRWAPPHAGAPTALLLHGTGAATHSWRTLAPLLAQHFALVAPDLPGHGFSGTAAAGAAGMAGMAQAIHQLLRHLGVAPAFSIGHSAGAAIAVCMRLQQEAAAATPATHTVVGLNAALLPLPGLPGRLFSPAAKLLALNPLVPHLFSWHAAQDRVLARLLQSTGSKLDAEGTALYRRLIESPDHVAGVLAMMAKWDLPALARELPRLRTPLHLVVADGDRTVPPADAERVRRLLPRAQVHRLPVLGHLAHEEDAPLVAALLLQQLPTAAAGR